MRCPVRLSSAAIPVTPIRTVRVMSTYAAPTGLTSFAMANVRPKYTGLPMIIYVSEKNARHGPRIKVSQSYGDQLRGNALFSVTIERNPRVIGKRGDIRARDIGLVMEFIELNMPLLLAYWEQEPVVDTLDMLQSLRKIET